MQILRLSPLVDFIPAIHHNSVPVDGAAVDIMLTFTHMD